ncbi:MAG: ferrochelatase [Anaerolineales bacterium]|jgi:ferrochelatase
MGLKSKEIVGVLLMAYGSPERIEDLRPYLLDIRGGRETPDSLVAEMTGRYRLIGGQSPLLMWTRRQGQALEKLLNERRSSGGEQFRIYLGMRHWEPRIKEALEQILADGVQTVVGLVMAPHNSRLSTGAYYAKLEEAIRDLEADITVLPIKQWHDHPGLIRAITENVRQAQGAFDDQVPYVIFSAHSLPARILSQGDPYDAQLKETAGLLAESLNLDQGRWQFCYQSAGQSAEPWLGPPIEDVIKTLLKAGEKNFLIVPIGFVCDHVEVLYDIDIVCKKLAEDHGARLVRSQSLNDSATFIAALADIVAQRYEQFRIGVA